VVGARKLVMGCGTIAKQAIRKVKSENKDRRTGREKTISIWKGGPATGGALQRSAT